MMMSMQYQLLNDNGKGFFDSRLLYDIKYNQDDLKTHCDLNLFPDDSGKLFDNFGRTLLHYAAEYGNNDFVSYLTQKLGAEVDQQDFLGNTPIMLASTSTMIDTLLDPKVNNHACDENSQCEYDIKIAEKLMEFNYVIHDIINFRRVQLTRLLLERGCPIVDPNTSLQPVGALVLAVKLCDLEHVKLLLDYGIDVNARSSAGRTPMSAYPVDNNAVDAGQRLEILRLLLDRGANPTKSFTSQNPDDDPSPYSNDPYSSLIDFDDEFLSALNSGAMQMYRILIDGNRSEIKMLIDANVDLKLHDKAGRTAIHYLSSNESPDSFSIIADKDFDVNVRSISGSTPLHLIHTSNFNAVRALHIRGADLNAKNKYGETPLMTLWENDRWRLTAIYKDERRFAYENSRRVVEYLLYNGADPQIELSNRRNPIFRDENVVHEDSIKAVISYLTIVKARGLPIVNFLANRINDNTFLKKCFDSYSGLLERLTKVKIWRSTSVYDCLVDSDAKIERKLRNKKFQLRLHRLKSKPVSNLGSYYSYYLRNRLAKLIRMTRMRKQVTVDLNEILGLSLLVTGKIASYLDECDVKKLCKNSKMY